MFSAINQALSITVCEDAADATKKGFDYNDHPRKALQIKQVVVVSNGTRDGNATVDLLLEDAEGNKFVTLVTGNLLKSIPC